MKRGTPAQTACVRQAIEQGGRADFPAILEALRTTRALEETRSQ